jgi:hypothetical protein
MVKGLEDANGDKIGAEAKERFVIKYDAMAISWNLL